MDELITVVEVEQVDANNIVVILSNGNGDAIPLPCWGPLAK